MCERLRALRHAARLRRDQLARAAGVSAQTVGNAERGAHAPTEETLRKLARALGVGVGRLMPKG